MIPDSHDPLGDDEGEVARLRREVQRLGRERDQLRKVNETLTHRNRAVEGLSADLLQLNLDLSQISQLDPLTRLLNRGAFELALAQAHELACSGGGRYAVIMIDVDHFKGFNDALGHQAGDDCLIRVAEAIRQTLRKSDFVGRYGGEEVIVLSPGINAGAAADLAERIRQTVRAQAIDHPCSATASWVTVSLGVAVGPAGGWMDVVGQADQKLYLAKRDGRNRTAA